MAHPFSWSDFVALPTQTPDFEGARGSVPLPCLYSNNSIREDEKEEKTDDEKGPDSWNILQGNHKKTAEILARSVEKMVALYGLEKVGFCTLTFAEKVTDAREAQRRLNSFLSNFGRERFKDYICVLERCKSGRIHFHLLVPMAADIRSGFDFEQVNDDKLPPRERYKSASPALKEFWADMREAAEKYGFGRTETMPIKSTAEAVKFYVGKYISKHIEQRKEDDKGVRLVRMSRGVRAGTVGFAWHSVGARLWRAKAGEIARNNGISEDELSGYYGKGWLFRNQDVVCCVIPDYAPFSDEEIQADSFPFGFHAKPDAMRGFLDEVAFFLGRYTYRLTGDEAGQIIRGREALRSGSVYCGKRVPPPTPPPLYGRGGVAEGSRQSTKNEHEQQQRKNP